MSLELDTFLGLFKPQGVSWNMKEPLNIKYAWNKLSFSAYFYFKGILPTWQSWGDFVDDDKGDSEDPGHVQTQPRNKANSKSIFMRDLHTLKYTLQSDIVIICVEARVYL